MSLNTTQLSPSVMFTLFLFQAQTGPANTNTQSGKGVSSGGGVIKSNGQGTPPAGDMVDLPKLKGIGRNRRARFSLYKHLQKHTMQHSDSVSSVDSAGAFL